MKVLRLNKSKIGIKKDVPCNIPIRKLQSKERPVKHPFRSLKGNTGHVSTGSKKGSRKNIVNGQCAFVLANGERCTSHAANRSEFCRKHTPISRVDSDVATPYADMHVLAMLQSKFDITYHPMRYIELAREGYSPKEIAAEFGITLNMLEDWACNVKEFAIAYEIGNKMHEAYYLRTGRRNIVNNQFNNGLYKFLTMNLFGYSDKIETNNHTTGVHGVLLVPSEMSVSEWESANTEHADAKSKAKAIEMGE